MGVWQLTAQADRKFRPPGLRCRLDRHAEVSSTTGSATLPHCRVSPKRKWSTVTRVASTRPFVRPALCVLAGVSRRLAARKQMTASRCKESSCGD
jgi:hypothetical protein